MVIKHNIIFGLRDEVEIIILKIKGVVKAIWITADGIEYQIRYFADNKPNSAYFFEDELKLKKKREIIGFKN